MTRRRFLVLGKMRPTVMARLGFFAAALCVGACVEDPELVHRGDGRPTPVDEPQSFAGDSGLGSAGGPNMPITWCEARSVLVAKCQRCHQDPPKNGAPMPLLSYEDTQGAWTVELRVYDVMRAAVDRDFMPYVELNGPPTNLMPPVEPLSAEEKVRLMRWLDEGALPEGGTDCP
jgi:hypothetical protein